jgi:hypothetical protein
MYIPGTEVREIKVISLIGVAEAIAKAEGTKALTEVIFDEVRDSDYGNQMFSNDSLYIYLISKYEDDRDEIQELIYNYCNDKGVIHSEEHDEFGHIYFAVCW